MCRIRSATDIMSGKAVAANLSQTWRTVALLCVHMMQVFFVILWVDESVCKVTFVLSLPPKSFNPQIKLLITDPC